MLSKLVEISKSILLRKSPEPSEVIYKNNHRSRYEVYQSLVCSYLACIMLLIVAYLLVKLVGITLYCSQFLVGIWA
jgi:hypothetical protein